MFSLAIVLSLLPLQVLPLCEGHIDLERYIKENTHNYNSRSSARSIWLSRKIQEDELLLQLPPLYEGHMDWVALNQDDYNSCPSVRGFKWLAQMDDSYRLNQSAKLESMVFLM